MTTAYLRDEYVGSPTAAMAKGAMTELEQMAHHSVATPLRKQFYMNIANLIEELEARILVLEADLELARQAKDPYVPNL